MSMFVKWKDGEGGKGAVLMVSVLLLAIAVSSGCTSYDHNVKAMEDARLRSEPMNTWTRPMEITYEFVGDVEGSSTFQRTLGITSGEAPRRSVGGAASMLIGAITQGQSADPSVNMAALNALRETGADGIYVTQVEVVTTNVGFLFYTQTTTVRGKAIQIVELGPVSEERADNLRYLRQLPAGTALPTSGSWLPVSRGDEPGEPVRREPVHEPAERHHLDDGSDVETDYVE